MTDKRPMKIYMRAVVLCGAALAVYSAYALPLGRLDAQFALLAVITIVVSSCLTAKIPRLSSHITVSDTFIFLTMLLYGGEAAVLLAAVEGLCSSMRVNRKLSSNLFNAAVMACATFLTVTTLRLMFGTAQSLSYTDFSPQFILAVCVMALAQYAFNSGLVSVLAAYKIDRPFWDTWRTYYLWTSITYFAGASAAGIIAKMIHSVGFYAVLVTTPIIAIIFFTYETYRKNIEASKAQAEQAERHVEELSLYLSEREQAERERDLLLVREREARAEAEAANRIKDEFLATLSHELRTPLVAIIGWADLLRSGRLKEEARAQALETIERSALAQSQLINELLDVSRIITGKLLLNTEELDLASVVGAAVEVMRPAANAKNIAIRQRCEPGAAVVSGDAARLQQVVWNLLANAVKFTPKGGRVEVAAECSDSHVTLSVSDTGRGISAEFLPHVFDRFRQADSTTTRRHGGLGLGLAIVRHLVELHGGTVTAESPGEGLGTTFSVSLPLAAGHVVASKAAACVREAGGEGGQVLGGVRVLVVDDEADTRAVISAVLAESGAEVHACDSTREALAELERWTPDVIMSDIGMPGEDGYALMREVRSRARASSIPAAALTAYARDEDRRLAYAAGFQKHLAKPVRSAELVNAVASLARTRATSPTLT
ncbi:MAG TPA: ATP-binding protein [Pyrinomonadaceae bacterium]|nr:ATP-binding protein [Pyrinomonadaceae bacterium]